MMIEREAHLCIPCISLIKKKGEIVKLLVNLQDRPRKGYCYFPRASRYRHSGNSHLKVTEEVKRILKIVLFIFGIFMCELLIIWALLNAAIPILIFLI